MRVVGKTAILLAVLIAAATPVCAAELVIPDTTPETYTAYASQEIQQPWQSQRPDSQLQERPIAEIIAAKLGVAQGSAELFRYHLENAPSASTQLHGVVDGGGIKLKLTW
jgi:hypothetical protein